VKALALAVGLIITLAGLVLMVVPAAVLSFAQHTMTPLELYSSGAIRIGIGLLLIFVAESSRMPRLLRILGAFALVAGGATLFLGLERAQAIADWTSRQGTSVVRGLGLVPIAIGALIVYACAPMRRAADGRPKRSPPEGEVDKDQEQAPR
jgi:uncharacterized protein YjeT (DUF2065 family)